ncbi:heavy-metal-associated domain-containing protein [Paenibacillus sp. 2RAB27]|uniref:heavy-metal-associated domain-containing protein n=1 Tax=Paenibacillus sp. 2RAB27 TaxID=3232991 RepID=UPI003F9B1374
MSKLIFKVEGMSCSHCVNAIESTLRQLGAVGSVDLENKSVHIVYDDANTTITSDLLKEAIENKGFEVIAQ